MSFSDSFTWGVATASFQIEGATSSDGRKPSVWDMMCATPGAIFEGNTGDVACDHYNRYAEDVALMKELGVRGYRFSIAWPRVIPDGECDVNPKGIAFYDRLVDKLLEAGIAPWATLYHWDLPLELYRRGGWLNPDSPRWFADYTRVIVDALSDRIQNWMTLNEPQCFIGLGMREGKHAPADKLRWNEVLLASHHALLAHGLAVQVIRSHARREPKVGMAPVGHTCFPATESQADIEAARTAMFSITKDSIWQATWWMDPIFFGAYPEDGLKRFGDQMPEYTAEDMKTIAQPLDFFGQNTYNGVQIRAGEDGKPVEVPHLPGHDFTAFRWPVTPQCLYWGPKFFYERYGKPIVITENGLSNQDWVALDGKVHDPQRIDFLHRHLRELKRAVADGVPIEGYFQWSLMDNFEWAEGYKERFGLIYVDYPTQKRIPKDSFYWYKNVIATNGAAL